MAFLGVFLGLLYSFGGLIVDLLTVRLNWGTAMAFGALIIKMSFTIYHKILRKF